MILRIKINGLPDITPPDRSILHVYLRQKYFLSLEYNNEIMKNGLPVI